MLDIESLEEEIVRSGNPIAVKVYTAFMQTNQDVLERRTHKLLYQGVVWAIHKAIYDSAFRPVFYELLANVIDNIDRQELDRYRKPPRDWKINRYARQSGK
jgi:hypothetical protein